jgi:hypothetical protein
MHDPQHLLRSRSNYNDLANMAFSHSRYIDVNISNFYDIGRDYNANSSVHLDNRTIHIYVSGSDAATHVLQGLNASDKLPSSTSRLDTLSPGVTVIPVCHTSTVSSGVDIATGLIVKIMQLLINHGAFSENCQDLKHDLQSLYQLLALTGLATEAYRFTPLGHNLAGAINPEIQQCRMLLQDVLDKAQSCQLALNATRINGLWGQVWSRGWDRAELASLRIKLATHRESFRRFLMALHSYGSLSFINRETLTH